MAQEFPHPLLPSFIFLLLSAASAHSSTSGHGIMDSTSPLLPASHRMFPTHSGITLSHHSDATSAARSAVRTGQFSRNTPRTSRSSLPGTHTRTRRLQASSPVLSGAFLPNGPTNFDKNSDGSVTITLTRDGGAGLTSAKAYSYGQFSIDAKFPGGFSAGVCTAFFLINGAYDSRGEWDFEFLGSATDGYGMNLQTNFFQNGSGDHAVLARYGFDPTADFHTYTMDWQPEKTVWSVDGREIRTVEKESSAYPSEPMTVALSIWDASEWATGVFYQRIPVNWFFAPFSATFKNFQYLPFPGV